MTKAVVFPKIEAVTPLPDKKLLVRFVVGEEKVTTAVHWSLKSPSRR